MKRTFFVLSTLVAYAPIAAANGGPPPQGPTLMIDAKIIDVGDLPDGFTASTKIIDVGDLPDGWQGPIFDDLESSTG